MIKSKKLFITLMIFLLCVLNISASAASMTLYYNGAAHEYNGRTYKLMIDGEYINPSVEPLIFNDYTLVPIRDVFEAIGAEVKYLDLSKQIFINYNETYVRLRIGDSLAYINDEKTKIPGGIVPMLISLDNINAKTMVPLRFVSEGLGFDVDFIDEKDLIKVSTEVTEFSTLTGFTVTEQSEFSTTIKVSADKAIELMTEPAFTNAGVMYFDIANCKYTAKNVNEINKGAVKNIRFGFSDNKTRIALDLENMKTYNVKLSSDKKTILISITASKAAESDEDKDNDNETVTRPKPNETTGEKIVVLDAGHGGTDPGAIGSVDGVEYKEKEINLIVAKKVKEILEAEGIHVIMTRDGDTYPSLTDRSDLANLYKAAMFVSIHANSATIDTATGFEVYYSNMNNSAVTGLSSSELAKSVCKEIDEMISIRNRGVKTADHVVTRTCVMPAILIEVGFMSNPEELALMFTDEFSDNFAEGVANGILSVWDKANAPTDEMIKAAKAELAESAESEEDSADADEPVKEGH